MLPIDVETFRLFLHVLAAAIWVGGQFTLAALLPVLRKAGADVPRSAARTFGILAWSAFAVLVVTGVWNIADYDHRSSDGFAATISVKLVFVVLSGLAAFVHSRAKSRTWLALGGAGAAVFSLAAMFFGVVLSG